MKYHQSISQLRILQPCCTAAALLSIMCAVQEDEKVWANRQAEVAGVALELERMIWEDLLADTAATLTTF